MERLLLRIPETAEMIGLGRSKTYELVANGTIPSIRIGKSVRVPVMELKRWLEKQSNPEGEQTGR